MEINEHGLSLLSPLEPCWLFEQQVAPQFPHILVNTEFKLILNNFRFKWNYCYTGAGQGAKR
jgi:hypothetical protein